MLRSKKNAMIQKNWWKLLSVMLLIYAFVLGMLVPLKPGVTNITPQTLKTGQKATCQITGYNTSFIHNTSGNKVWLKLDDTHAVLAEDLRSENDNTMSATFIIPNGLPEGKRMLDATLIIDNDQDGAFPYPSAVSISQDTATNPKGVNWSVFSFANLHTKQGMTYPFRNILSETIRNTYFHVPLWFAMMFLFLAACIFSFLHLKTQDKDYDIKAKTATRVGILYGILGCVTGAIWAKNTWGEYWSFDPKQNMSAICLLIYCAYFVLRGAFEDEEKRARIAAVYNIFAFAAMIPLLFVIPRMVASLHPGNGGNPAFGTQDLDNTMRMIFYPAIIGFTLFGAWLGQLDGRMERIEERLIDEDL